MYKKRRSVTTKSITNNIFAVGQKENYQKTYVAKTELDICNLIGKAQDMSFTVFLTMKVPKKTKYIGGTRNIGFQMT